MMKTVRKVLYFVMVFGILLTILACQDGELTSLEDLTTNDGVTEQATTDIGTNEQVTPVPSTSTEVAIDPISYEIDNDLSTSLGMYRFDGNFVDPEYHPIIGNLTFTLEINDDDYRNSTYFVVVREVNSPDFDFLQAFTIEESTASRYHSIDYTPGKEVIVAKIAGTVYSDHVYLEPVASLRVSDSMANARKTLSGYTIIGNELRDIDMSETPYLDYSVLATDPDRIISSIKTIIYYPNYDLVLDTQVFEVTDDMYIGDQLSIDNIISDNLPPEKTFTIIYYVSGHDGVSDFEDVQLTSKRMTSANYESGSSIRNAYPGFWGFIHDFELNENDTRVYIHYINDQVLSMDDVYLTASLNVYDDEGVLVESYPLIDGMTYLDIPNEYLDDFYLLIIQCDQSDEYLSIFYIRYDFELTATYADQIVRVSYREPWAEVISIYLKMTTVEDGSVIAELTMTDLEDGYTNIPYPEGPDGYFSQYDVYIEITYIGFHGQEVYVTGYLDR